MEWFVKLKLKTKKKPQKLNRSQLISHLRVSGFADTANGPQQSSVAINQTNANESTKAEKAKFKNKPKVIVLDVAFSMGTCHWICYLRYILSLHERSSVTDSCVNLFLYICNTTTTTTTFDLAFKKHRSPPLSLIREHGNESLATSSPPNSISHFLSLLWFDCFSEFTPINLCLMFWTDISFDN